MREFCTIVLIVFINFLGGYSLALLLRFKSTKQFFCLKLYPIFVYALSLKKFDLIGVFHTINFKIENVHKFYTTSLFQNFTIEISCYGIHFMRTL